MASTLKQRSDHISNVRQATKDIICALDKLTRLHRQYTTQRLGADFSDADFVGENEGLKKADLVQVYATKDALIALLDANNSEHAKNLYAFLTNIC